MSIAQEIKVPDIGTTAQVDVIEVLVKPGDTIEVDTSLITLESDKASMEIPSPAVGVVKDIKVKVGDKITQDDVILTFLPADDAKKSKAEESKFEGPRDRESKAKALSTSKIEQSTAAEETQSTETPSLSKIEQSTAAEETQSTETPSLSKIEQSTAVGGVKSTETPSLEKALFAGPAARRLAHTLGVDLSHVSGTGRQSRITKDDVEHYVKQCMSGKTASGISPALGAAPVIDFSQFGPTEIKPLNKINRLTGINMQRSWQTIPQVTQFDEADVTELEAFRRAELASVEQQGVKLTLLAFVCKVVATALKVFPAFNASLDSTGENLIYKQYTNVGIAVDTPQGLVVPVIKHVDSLSVTAIAKEMARLSAKAREKGLMPVDMSGGCFTISSLGGIGGTAFTPIVNSPEVAILGLSRTSIKPMYIEGRTSESSQFKPRLILPLSLTYDHRVIDGAAGARFTRFLCEALADVRRILL